MRKLRNLKYTSTFAALTSLVAVLGAGSKWY